MSDRKGARALNMKGFPCRFHHSSSPNWSNENAQVPNAAMNFNPPAMSEDHVVPEYLSFDDMSLDSHESFGSPPDVKSPLYSRSFINLLNDSDVMPDVDPVDEMAYYEMLNEQLPAVEPLQRRPIYDMPALLMALDNFSIASEETDESQLYEHDLSECSFDEEFAYITVPPETFRSHFQHKESMTFTEEDQYLALDDNLLPFSDDFAFNRASPETFRSFFEFKENSYPDEPAEKPKMLELSDIMDLIINSASPQCTEGVSLLDPLSSIADRFRHEQADVDVSNTVEDLNDALNKPSISRNLSSAHNENAGLDVDRMQSASEDFATVEDVELNDLFSQDAHIAVEYATTPTTGLMFQFGGVSYEKVDNIDDFDKDEDEVFVMEEPTCDVSDERNYLTPPHTMKDDEEFYSFLSSRGRKIARNMSAGRRERIRDQDCAYVQPKKLFLD